MGIQQLANFLGTIFEILECLGWHIDTLEI